ncbi:Gfo/Idh/MocA family oxidoreductase [soil metagenome]
MSIGIGLIGPGRRLRSVVARLLREGGEGLKVVAAYDPDPISIEETRTEFGDVRVCGSEAELLGSAEVNWVFIGSFNNRHGAQAVAALRSGKGVFCEKPLATTLGDCVAVRNAVKETGRAFAFGLVLRYSPHYRKLKSLVEEGTIGRIVSFEFNETLNFFHGGYIFGNWRRQKELAGSHMLEKCCHDLDLANWITGSLPVKVASLGGRDVFGPENAHLAEGLARGANGREAYRVWDDNHGVDPFSEGAEINDNQVVILEYANGSRATFHTNCNTALPERRFYLCGTKGTLRGDAITGRIELRRIGHDTEVEYFDTNTDAMPGHAGGDEVMANGLAATLLNGETPLATVEDGVRACVAAFGIDQACETGEMVDLRPLWQACQIDLST